MNATEFLRQQARRDAERPLVFHERAIEFCDLYDIDESLIEGVVRHPRSVTDDPHGAEVGYPIKRYRRGDIEAVVGYQFPAEPAVLYIYLHLPIDPSNGGSKGGSTGSGRTAPRTVQDMHKRMQAVGYSVEVGGRHTRILRPNGSLLMGMSRTPSDHRALTKIWTQFLRLHALNSLDDAS